MSLVAVVSGCGLVDGRTHPRTSADRLPVDRATLVSTSLIAAPVDPQDEFQPRATSSSANAAVPLGVGFTADPGTFLIGGAVDIPAGENIYWGPALQVGFSDERFLIAPFLQGKYVFSGDASDAPKIKPFLQTGVGFVYSDESSRSGDSSLLINAGGGLRFDLEGRNQLASTVLWNWAPGGIQDQHSYLSWEVLQLVIPF